MDIESPAIVQGYWTVQGHYVPFPVTLELETNQLWHRSIQVDDRDWDQFKLSDVSKIALTYLFVCPPALNVSRRAGTAADSPRLLFGGPIVSTMNAVASCLAPWPEVFRIRFLYERTRPTQTILYSSRIALEPTNRIHPENMAVSPVDVIVGKTKGRINTFAYSTCLTIGVQQTVKDTIPTALHCINRIAALFSPLVLRRVYHRSNVLKSPSVSPGKSRLDWLGFCPMVLVFQLFRHSEAYADIPPVEEQFGEFLVNRDEIGVLIRRFCFSLCRCNFHSSSLVISDRPLKRKTLRLQGEGAIKGLGYRNIITPNEYT
ncbi:hypothetical protein C8J56DRAFT_889248 [Mycena floridula]|nr:hypothetical protein C8J56DRAFT_889248 [Mycena floridula]